MTDIKARLLDDDHPTPDEESLWRFWNEKAQELAVKNTALEARIEELEGALKPFAEYPTADGLPGGMLRIPDGHALLFKGVGEEMREAITIGHFRNARRTLSKGTGQ